MNHLSKTELAIIAGMVDELVVNGGILDLKKLRISAENTNLHELSRIACQYYAMMREGTLAFDFSDIEKYLHLLSPSADSSPKGICCLACGADDSISITPESSFIPLCRSCHGKLDQDIAIMSSLMSR